MVLRRTNFEKMGDCAGLTLELITVTYDENSACPVIMPERYLFGVMPARPPRSSFTIQSGCIPDRSWNQFRFHRKGISFMLRVIDAFSRRCMMASFIETGASRSVKETRRRRR